METNHGRGVAVVAGASAPRRGDRGSCRAPERGVRSVTKRLSWVVVMILGSGCVFTPRPMIPYADDAAGGLSSESDSAVTGTPFADAGSTSFSDAAAWDAASRSDAPSPEDSNCHRESDAGDSGYVDRDGAPCDPTASPRDGGAGDVPDGSCDAGDGAADASCDGGPGAGQTGLRR